LPSGDVHLQDENLLVTSVIQTKPAMNASFLRAALALLILVLPMACGTEKPKKPTAYSIAQFMDIVQITGGAFSPDDRKIMISSKATGIFNAVEIDIESGTEKPLTTSADNAIYGLSYFPGDERIVYTSGPDQGFNGQSHVCRLELQPEADVLRFEQPRQALFRSVQCSGSIRGEEHLPQHVALPE
jgi:hypothetical protein